MDSWLDKFGKNWKSTAGGVALILVGAGGIILRLVNPDHENAMAFEVGIGLIAAGLSALGIGHKVERANREVEAARLDQRMLQEDIKAARKDVAEIKKNGNGGH